MKKYQIIYADPPWQYWNWAMLKSDKLRRQCGHMCYPTMTLKEICDLPIDKIADEKCVLFLWVTPPKLPEAFDVIKSWGFEYKTIAFTWIKQNLKNESIWSGIGHWTLSNPELCLLATHKKFPKRLSPVKQLVFAPRGIHSAKPPIIRNKIIELVGDLPRIELFARKPKEQLFEDESFNGWDVWGNEVESDIELL